MCVHVTVFLCLCTKYNLRCSSTVSMQLGDLNNPSLTTVLGKSGNTGKLHLCWHYISAVPKVTLADWNSQTCFFQTFWVSGCKMLGFHSAVEYHLWRQKSVNILSSLPDGAFSILAKERVKFGYNVGITINEKKRVLIFKVHIISVSGGFQ